MLKKYQHLIISLIIIFFAFLGTKALFHPDLYSSHDIWHNVARFYHYHHALKDGQILPAWISNMAKGYGYPLFYFSYHLPWVVGEIILLFGFNFFTAFKLIYFSAFLLSGFSMYFFCKYIFKQKLAALLAAIVYMWAPFHFFTIFVSASVGMAWIFVFLPLIFLGLWQIYEDQVKKGIVITGLALAGAILSHLMTTIMFAPFFALFGLSLVILKKASIKEKLQALATMFLSGLLGLTLTAFYLIPLFKFYPLIQAAQQKEAFGAIYKSNFVNLKQLIYSKWGYGPIISNAKDGEVSFQIGLAQWLGFIFASFILTLKQFFKRKVADEKKYYLLVIFFALSIFFILEKSKIYWDKISKFFSLDYPFRLIILSVFFASLLIAWSIKNINSKLLKYLLSVLFLSLAIYSNRNHIKVNMYTDFSLETYVNAETTTNTYHEYLPVKASDQVFREDFSLEHKNNYKIEVLDSSTKKTEVKVINNQEQAVSLPQFNFPGQILLNNNLEEIKNFETDDFGRIKLNLKPGIHKLIIQYRKPPIVIFSYLISVISIFSIIYFVNDKKNKG